MNFTSLPTRWNPLGQALLALFALGMCVAPARAAYETATFSNVNPGEVVTITDTALSINGESGWAGDYNFINASGFLNSSSYLGYCIDIAQDIYANQTVTWSVTSLADAPTPGTAMGQTNANLIAELWYNDYGMIGTSNSNAAAFQVAIWEIINGGTSNLSFNSDTSTLSNGTLTVTETADPGTLNTAYTWLEQLNANGDGPTALGLIALTSSDYQDYVVQDVPAPTGWVCVVSGALTLLLPLGWRRRKAFARAVR